MSQPISGKKQPISDKLIPGKQKNGAPSSKHNMRKSFFIHGIFHCVQFSILEIRKLTFFTSCHVYTRYIFKSILYSSLGNKQMHLNIELPITINIEVFDYQLSMEFFAVLLFNKTSPLGKFESNVTVISIELSSKYICRASYFEITS